jgi:hypothetical protein
VGYSLDLWGMNVTLLALSVATLVIFASLIVPLLLAVRRESAQALEAAEPDAEAVAVPAASGDVSAG